MLDVMFDHVFVINLDRRPDRLQEITNELVNNGICSYEKFSAVDGKTLTGQYNVPIGHVGCTLSHLGVAQLAKERGYKNYVVLEDDAVFSPSFKEDFVKAFKHVPKDWDCIFLGGSHVGGFDIVNDYVIRMKGSYTTHAMIINETFYDKIIGVWKGFNTTQEVDVAMASLHKDNNCYSFRNALAHQRAGHSDILEKYDDYKHLRYNGIGDSQQG